MCCRFIEVLLRKLMLLNARQHVGHGGAGLPGIKVGLQIDPALRVSAKVRRQPKRGGHRDATKAFNDLIVRW